MNEQIYNVNKYIDRYSMMLVIGCVDESDEYVSNADGQI